MPCSCVYANQMVLLNLQDRSERTPSNEQPGLPVQSGLAAGTAGTWAPVPYTVPFMASAISPLAGMEPPVFPPAPDLEKAQGDERQVNLLLEVLNHCKLLHTAVQRLEQKVDNLQSNRCTTRGCRKQAIPQERPFTTGQLSQSLAQRLGPSPQSNRRRYPVPKRSPAPQATDTTEALQSDQCSIRTTTRPRGGGGGGGGNRGKGRRKGRSGGARKGSHPQQPKQEPPLDEAFLVKEESQPAKVLKKKGSRLDMVVKKLKKQMKSSAAAGGQAKTQPVKLEDGPPDEKDKKVMIGSATRKVWIPQSVYMQAFKEAEPQKAVAPVLYALFPISTLSCSAITSDPLRGIQQLDPNKLEALREWLAEMFPQQDMSVRGLAWAQCLGVINSITKDLHRREELSGRVERAARGEPTASSTTANRGPELLAAPSAVSSP
ncbi:uncharacterized protein [Salminus brasiliensis]|uniref:uncharacterized protein n=1 Tax=Salminus brasiliensis TaxID=930266 RepID=UPI003B835027